MIPNEFGGYIDVMMIPGESGRDNDVIMIPIESRGYVNVLMILGESERGNDVMIPCGSTLYKSMFICEVISRVAKPLVYLRHDAFLGYGELLSPLNQQEDVGPFLLDVMPLSLGLETVVGRRRCHGCVDSQKLHYPTKKEQIFSIYFDNHPGVFIRVYESERTRIGDNKVLGKLNSLTSFLPQEQMKYKD
ncbi:Heat shock 70 kDa protein [Capsicum chinense]|nr:Heat shock 70 kDa protein [Capsicum chinense]